MDVFDLRDQLVRDYRSYITSFINIRDQRINAKVSEELENGALWPDPLIQLNPTFEPGGWIDDLVDEGLLHPECRGIFRIKPEPDKSGSPLRLHRHQLDAIRVAAAGHNYVLTTGTGSGKSLAYIVPIVDYVLRSGSGQGIQAIIIYPMNALANSQLGELEKFLGYGFPDGNPPVTFARYTGQDSDERRLEIIARPPDILLTNFAMLELILTRPDEAPLLDAAKGLRFLVLDELHTYRGRQGADVALLVRRVRELLDADHLQYVGTSATLAGPGTLAEQQSAIASLATTFFGAPVSAGDVISETLRRSTSPAQAQTDQSSYVEVLRRRVAGGPQEAHLSLDAFLTDPLAGWIEGKFGVSEELGSGRLRRSKPRGIRAAAGDLANLTGLPLSRCLDAIRQTLLTGYHLADRDTGFPLFAFRLHQVFSPGDAVYTSIEPPEDRYITLNGQQFVPGDRRRVLLPLVFCRECGQEYLSVRKTTDPRTSQTQFTPRDLLDAARDDTSEPGYLFIDPTNPWPEELEDALERLPDDWLEESSRGRRLKSTQRKYLPKSLPVDLAGNVDPSGLEACFLPSPFRFCLHCGVAYDARTRSDFAKLSSLGFEGRSTATTILSLAAIRSLRQDLSLPERARKLLDFTDNRQDASLQAGHFNDFVEIGLLRGAIYRAALEAGPEGLRHEELPQQVFAALDLDPYHYSSNPEARFQAAEEAKRALRDVLGYRIYRDLRRGWRVTAPNLEQAGLLEIGYLSLDELCQDEPTWSSGHTALVSASPATRARIGRTLLDYLRRELAIKVDYLDQMRQEQIKQRSSQRLIPPWAIDEGEHLEYATILLPRSQRPGDDRRFRYLSPRSGFGQFLRRSSTFPDYGERLTLVETGEIIQQLLQALVIAGIVEVVLPANDKDEVPGYQLVASALRWVAGDGSRAFHDPIRVPNEPDAGHRPNRFFVDYYRLVALGLKGIEAREHTAQVPYELREEREERFREGRLPVLFCSPTMELGVDISQLNVVGLRNVPPTPANYAQRSGRAGRSGEPALVFTYCATGSPHDQFFFRHPDQMVAGAVTSPRLDLANEDLVRAHIHAIWLKETGQSLHKSLAELLDRSGDPPGLPILPEIRQTLESDAARRRAYRRSEGLLASLAGELTEADWWTVSGPNAASIIGDGWLDEVLNSAVHSFDAAAGRWRTLYQAAVAQRERQHRIIGDASRSHEDKQLATRLRREAESQIELLTDIGSLQQSDFYSYRYFASEGFLPGYSFPRLPLSAFIPGRQSIRGQDEFLQRSRFLAISEFGPQALIYHEGSRYVINRVILSVSPDQEEDAGPITLSIKQCPSCGYLHRLNADEARDLCQRCGAPLGEPMHQLLRLQNVATRRRDRINSDEEDRMRLGYEIRTGVRFASRDDRISERRTAVTGSDGASLANLTYAPAATVWRINIGWARRKDRERYGFVLDTERGYWARSEQDPAHDPEEPDDPRGSRNQRVIPYVEDTRNCLLLELPEPQPEPVMASLQAALKTAIQLRYQLEDYELTAEPLPSREDRRLILFCESAEGGAGVLRRLVDEPAALGAVASTALSLCHFDRETGEDRHHAPGRDEACEAACYDCLLSYGNQRDHALLDRQLIQPFLLSLTEAAVSPSPSELSRSEHLGRLLNQCQSELERDWLTWIDAFQLRLPTAAQKLIESCDTRPDFVYEGDAFAAIFIDGPHHDEPRQQRIDRQQQSCLRDAGYSVIRFGYRDRARWQEVVERYPHIFGKIVEA